VRSVGVHYPREQAGKAATLTYTVRVRDDRGKDLSREIASQSPRPDRPTTFRLASPSNPFV